MVSINDSNRLSRVFIEGGKKCSEGPGERKGDPTLRKNCTRKVNIEKNWLKTINAYISG